MTFLRITDTFKKTSQMLFLLSNYVLLNESNLKFIRIYDVLIVLQGKGNGDYTVHSYINIYLKHFSINCWPKISSIFDLRQYEQYWWSSAVLVALSIKT